MPLNMFRWAVQIVTMTERHHHSIVGARVLPLLVWQVRVASLQWCYERLVYAKRLLVAQHACCVTRLSHVGVPTLTL